MSSNNNNNNNNGKVAVITGSSKGIGKAIAKEFAKTGYSIVLNSRDKEDLSRAIQSTTCYPKPYYVLAYN